MSETSAGTHVANPELPYAGPLPVKIITYKDLLDEEQRLTLEFKRNKAQLMEDINTIREKLQPADKALNFMNRFSGGTGKPGLLSTGVDIALDLLSKKYLFRRSGWLITLAGSYLVRGASQFFLRKTISKKDSGHKIKSNGEDHSTAEEIPDQ